MNWRRFMAILHARNLEFVRDRSALGWSILLPVLLILGFAFIFSDSSKDLYKVGVYHADGVPPQLQEGDRKGFFATDYIDFVTVSDLNTAIDKVKHHQLDMLLDLNEQQRYWVNSTSAKGYVLERVLWGANGNMDTAVAFQKQTVDGREVRYVDWVMPGILAMNMMFGCLFGIGYVIVRYRKNGVLKRLKATPLTAFEFVSAQVASRVLLIIAITVFVFIGTDLLIDFVMLGSYATLLFVFLLGAFCLICLALIMAARTSSEEFAGGILNLIAWPMMIFSGVWFSLEGLHPAAQFFSKLLPLTHVVDAARAVMNDGAGLLDILPQLGVLTAMTAVFLAIGASLFRWE
jgi:ABC-type multidrug transport system permease subunit